MASSTKGHVKKGRQPSIKHSCNLAEAKRKLSKISDHHSHVDYAYVFQRDNRKPGETKLSQFLSRDALISAVDLIWDRSDFVSADLDFVNRDEVSKFKVSADSTQLPADQKANSQLSSTPQPRVKLLGVAEKIYTFDPYNQRSWFNQSDGAKSISGFCKENGILFESRWKTLYSWMEGVVPTSTRYHEEAAEIEKREHFEDPIPNPLSSKAELASRNANSCDCVFDTTGAKSQSTVTEPRSPLLASVAGSLVDTRISRSNDVNDLSLLCKDRCANNKGVNIISSKCNTDCVTEVSSSGNNSDEDSFSIVENKRLLERDRKGQETEVCSSSVETPTYAFVAKQRHAFAGALAGISVSLCLHPLDTVKTMIQSCRLGEKSLCNTGRSIISERGRIFYF